MSAYDFQFGSHSRDHGYHPDFEQARAWFATVLQAVEAVALSDLPVAEATRRAIAGAFRGLWTKAQVFDEIEQVSRSILAKRYWAEGWIAAREILSFDGADMEADARDRLIRLERELRPKDLVQKVRSVVLSHTHGGIDLEEYEAVDPDTEYQRAESLAEKLGEEVAVDDAVVRELLPDLVTGSSERLISFGRGLAVGAVAPRATWEALAAGFSEAPEVKRNGPVLGGFLEKLVARDPTLAGTLLHEAVEHPALGPWFPRLQCALPIDHEGVERLRRSLALGVAPVGSFRCLAWGRAHEPVPTAELRDLIERIAAIPAGNGVAIEIVFYRLFGDQQAKRTHEPEIIEAGRALLAELEFENTPRQGHELGLVIMACLSGATGAAVAAKLCSDLRRATEGRHVRIEQYDDAFEALCKAQPRTVLEMFFGGSEQERRATLRMMDELCHHHRNPLDAIPDDEIVAWCEQEPTSRYVTMASVVSYLCGSKEKAPAQWSGIALTLLERAPDPVAVARTFAKRFRPGGWSGSLAVILEGRRKLLTDLEQHADPQLIEFAIAEGLRLDSDIEAQRKWEAEHDQERNERFE
jgi:hypothetical protein